MLILRKYFSFLYILYQLDVILSLFLLDLCKISILLFLFVFAKKILFVYLYYCICIVSGAKIFVIIFFLNFKNIRLINNFIKILIIILCNIDTGLTGYII